MHSPPPPPRPDVVSSVPMQYHHHPSSKVPPPSIDAHRKHYHPAPDTSPRLPRIHSPGPSRIKYDREPARDMPQSQSPTSSRKHERMPAPDAPLYVSPRIPPQPQRAYSLPSVKRALPSDPPSRTSPREPYLSPQAPHVSPREPTAHFPPSLDGLPPGWVKQYDPVSQRDFYVDTAVARSTWTHPFRDEQYLREHAQRRRDKQPTVRHHGSASQRIEPVNVQQHKNQVRSTDTSLEPPRKKPRVAAANSPESRPASSAHDDLTRELGLLLRREFSFPGKYCHAATTPSAANPGLTVKGLGILGLPLSARDAQLVQSVVTQPPTVGNIWELDARDVECGNPAWATYLEEIVLKDIWKKLAPHCSRPRLELQSLLLWEATADILEYECTVNPARKTDEFGTIHVILPSQYTGGHVQLSYAGCSENYDLSATSSFSTSFITWYHGVDCLIKPVESGRRLALSYRLVAADDERPQLPIMPEKLGELNRFLRQWSDIQEYEPDAAPSIIAYPLEHEYRDNDLRADTLKFEDRHKVIHMKSVCDELGFQLGLAILDDHLIGTADEASATRDGQGRPRMLRVNSRRLTIKEVFDFDGVALPGLKKLELKESDLVKTETSESAPDLVVYEAKDPHVIEFHYYRTVMLLYERRRTIEALLHTRKASYALERLYNVDRQAPSPVERKIVAYVLASLYRQQPYNFTAQSALADIALGWNDCKMWVDTVRSTCSHGSLISALESVRWLAAWKQFSFAEIRQSIEFCWTTKGVKKCLEFFLEADEEAFLSLEPESSRERILHWWTETLQKSLDTLQHLEREIAPLFIALIRKKGIAFFWNVVMRSVTCVPNAYDFWVDFLRSLYAIRHDNVKCDEDAKTFDSLADEGLDTILSDFSLIVRSGDISLRHRRLSEIIDLCLSTRRLDMCRRVLFMTVPRDQGSDWVPDIMSPLYVPPLRRTLRDHGMEVYHKPFNDFFRAVIGAYLHHVLGPFHGKVRSISEMCSVCAALDDFVLSPKLTQAHFVGAKTHTAHLQTHLTGASDILSFYSITDPAVVGGNVLIVDKEQNPEKDVPWGARKNRAVEFLNTIGDFQIIERLMGTRYNDVLLALDGKVHFIHLEDGSRAGSQLPGRGIAIHHLVQGRWVATSLADVGS